MAFENNQGAFISYDCSDLIAELKEDVREFGADLIVEVVTEVRAGVTLYKDYNFINDAPSELKAGEGLVRMTALALLTIYEKQNSII